MSISHALFVVLFTGTAAVWDWRTKRLPNALTVTAFVAALLFHLISGGISGGWAGAGHGLLFALAGFATGFGILLVLWLIGGGGGGDVKLMGALGAWLGAVGTLQVFLISTVLVIVGSVGVVVWEVFRVGVTGAKRRYMSRPSDVGGGRASHTAAQERRLQRRRLLPYGVPVAIATWCVLGYAMFLKG